jgi:hypothetical protein
MAGANYLLILGNRVGLGWVLTRSRMAFPDPRRSEVRDVSVGDALYLYATRTCFGNPGRDRGRVIAVASVTSAVEKLEQPVKLVGREFIAGCGLSITSIAPLGLGPELRPLVPSLDAFGRSAEAWSWKLRRPLLRITPHDAKVLDGALKTEVVPIEQAVSPYLQWYEAYTTP